MFRFLRAPRLSWILFTLGVLLVVGFSLAQFAGRSLSLAPSSVSPGERAALIAYGREVLAVRDEAYALAGQVQHWELSGEKTAEAFLPLHQQAEALLHRLQALVPPEKAAQIHPQLVGAAERSLEALSHRRNGLRTGSPQEKLTYRALSVIAHYELEGAFGAFWELYDRLRITEEELVGAWGQ